MPIVLVLTCRQSSAAAPLQSGFDLLPSLQWKKQQKGNLKKDPCEISQVINNKTPISRKEDLETEKVGHQEMCTTTPKAPHKIQLHSKLQTINLYIKENWNKVIKTEQTENLQNLVIERSWRKLISYSKRALDRRYFQNSEGAGREHGYNSKKSISLQMRMHVLYGNNLFGSSQKTKRILLLEVDAKFIIGVYQCVSITGEQAQTYKINKVIAIILNMWKFTSKNATLLE